MVLVSDLAICKAEDDLLERREFSNNIADLIAKRESREAFTVGLMGAWGSGKSSILNLIDNRIKDEYKNIITIFFNPWRYSGENELLMSFFNHIAEALDEKLETNGELVKNFFKRHTEKVGSLISVMAGDPTNSSQGIATWLSSFLKTSELDDFKSRVQELLREKKKKVVIYVDDIDRLPRKEIQDLFKVIKLLGDFDHVTYILALDKDVVTQALGEAFSFDKSTTFLEKIIQLQIEVPLINKKILFKEWRNSLDRVLNSNNINFNDKEWFELQESLEKGFLHNLDDLRKIKNIENSLSYVLPILKNKVYVADLIVIESMRFFYPNLYSALKYKKIDIFDERKDFDERVALYNNSNAQDERNKRIIKEFYEITRIKEISNYHGILSVIKKLFPTIKRFFTGSNYGIETQELKAKLRVGRVDFFERYFSYSLNPQEPPEFIIKEIILEKNQFELFKKKIKEILETYDHSQVISKIFIYIDVLEKDDKVIILKYLLKSYFLVDENYNENGFFPIKNNIRLLSNIVDCINTYDLIEEFFISPDFLDDLENNLFINFYYRFSEYNRFFENKQILDIFSKKVLLRVNSGMSLIDFQNEFIISRVLKLLRLQNDFNSEIYLSKIINSKEDLEVFLTAFCVISHPGGRQIKFDKDILEFIHTFYPIEKINSKINQFCPDMQSKTYEQLHLDRGVIGKYLISLKEIELEN